MLSFSDCCPEKKEGINIGFDNQFETKYEKKHIYPMSKIDRLC